MESNFQAAQDKILLNQRLKSISSFAGLTVKQLGFINLDFLRASYTQDLERLQVDSKEHHRGYFAEFLLFGRSYLYCLGLQRHAVAHSFSRSFHDIHIEVRLSTINRYNMA